MTVLVNGRDEGPLEGWVIQWSHGMWMIGLPDARARMLRPVYELKIAMVPNPQTGQILIARSCWPILTMPSVKQWKMVANYESLLAVSSLTTRERQGLKQAVDSCEEILRQMRAQDAGIVIAPAGAVPQQ